MKIFVNILKINSNFVNICPSEFLNLTLLSRQQQSFRKFELLQLKHVENKWKNENYFFLQVFLMFRFLCHIMSSAKQKICFWKKKKMSVQINTINIILLAQFKDMVIRLSWISQFDQRLIWASLEQEKSKSVIFQLHCWALLKFKSIYWTE